VTGAAGVLAGGWDGGASWELDADGWRAAGVAAAPGAAGVTAVPVPVDGEAGAGEPAPDAGDRLTAGLTVLAWPGTAWANAAARPAVAAVAAAAIATDSDLMWPNTRWR
jgi:hypothetical protein